MNRVKEFLIKNGAWIGFFLLIVILTVLTQGGFLSPRNLTNLIRQASINGVLASGMTLVILSSGIDLSIGSLVALTGIIVGYSQVSWGYGSLGITGAILSLGLALLGGSLCGGVSGGLIAFLKIPPFVITLGMMVIARGLALILSNGSGISPISEELRVFGEGYLSFGLTILLSVILILPFVFKLRQRKWGEIVFPVLAIGLFTYAFLNYKGFPIPAVFLMGVVFLVSGALNFTVFGRSVFAIGSNEQAAYWAGVHLKAVKVLIYTVMGGLAGLSGVLLTARLNSAVPTAGELFELDAIAAVVIGGTSLKGGSGSVLGSLVGALTMATLSNGMDLVGVPSFYQMVFKGVIIILAVSLDRGRQD